jgi:hypothetical protein
VVIGLPYPNPVLGQGTVHWDVQGPPGTTVTWDVFTTAFRKVAGGSQGVSGNATLSWNLTDKAGNRVSDGLYYLRVKAVVGQVSTAKILKLIVLN